MVRGGVHFSLWRKFVDDLWQVFRQKGRGLRGIHSYPCSNRFDLIRTKHLLNLIAGNWLVFAHANPRLERVPLAALCKFASEALQAAALCEKTAENSHQRIRFTGCPAFSTDSADY